MGKLENFRILVLKNRFLGKKSNLDCEAAKNLSISVLKDKILGEKIQFRF